MIPVSDAFLRAMRTSHSLKTVAICTPASGPTLELPIEDGSITMDRTADQRRRLDLQISDALLYPDSPTDPVNVFGATVAISRGVVFGNGVEELVPVGIYRLEDAGREIPSGSLAITGWDLSRQVVDARFLKPRRLNQMTGIALIELLISEVFPGAQFDVTATDTATNVPKHVVERDRWAEVKRVAQMLGAEVFPTATGIWRIQDVPNPASATVVWDIDAGATGVLVGASNKVTREGAPNIVVAIGESMDGNQDPVYGIARDTNPLSPTYYLGKYGQVPRFYSSPHLKTQAQADRVAAAQLADHLGVGRTVAFTAVPNPALEAGDAIRLVYPDGLRETHLIDSLTMPLVAAGAMTGETRAVEWDAA